MALMIPQNNDDLQAQATGAAPRVPWGLRDMILAALATVGMLLVGIFAIAAAALALGWAGQAELPRQVMVVIIFAAEGLFVLPVWLFGPGRYRSGWVSLGLRPFRPQALGLTALLFLATLAVSGAWGLVQQRLNLADQPEILPWFGGGGGGLALALLVGAVIAPLAEEILFRGFFYAGLRERWGVGWAMALSSAVFAALHPPLGVMPPVFVMGVFFCVLYQRSGSLWPSVLLHAAINALSFAGAYLAERYPQLISGL